MTDRLDRTRALYAAWASGDRAAVEDLLAPEFTFSAPPDPLLDRAGYFERCWPHSGDGGPFHFKRLQEISDTEVLVTYENARGRNTEIQTFAGDQLVRTEVYFGWDL